MEIEKTHGFMRLLPQVLVWLMSDDVAGFEKSKQKLVLMQIWKIIKNVNELHFEGNKHNFLIK